MPRKARYPRSRLGRTIPSPKRRTIRRRFCIGLSPDGPADPCPRLMIYSYSRIRLRPIQAASMVIYTDSFSCAINFFKFLSQVLNHSDFHFQLTDGKRDLLSIRMNAEDIRPAF